MSKQRHLLLVVGFLMMTASVCIGQVNTAKPGEQAERHLSSDQSMKQWSLTSNQPDDIKRIKVCRVEDRLQDAIQGRPNAADASQESRHAAAV